MTKLGYTEARRNLAKILNRVEHCGERVIIQRRNKDVAVVVSVEDLERLVAFEDEMDEAWAQQALARARDEVGEPIPYEQYRQERGL